MHANAHPGRSHVARRTLKALSAAALALFSFDRPRRRGVGDGTTLESRLHGVADNHLAEDRPWSYGCAARRVNKQREGST